MLIAFRAFFIACLLVDLVFLYALVFDRDLPRRIAIRFFGGLSGQTVHIPPTEDRITFGQGFGVAMIMIVPLLVWAIFEYCLAAGIL
jgi:hypothetical protein